MLLYYRERESLGRSSTKRKQHSSVTKKYHPITRKQSEHLVWRFSKLNRKIQFESVVCKVLSCGMNLFRTFILIKSRFTCFFEKQPKFIFIKLILRNRIKATISEIETNDV